jgi:hypothetical protein
MSKEQREMERQVQRLLIGFAKVAEKEDVDDFTLGCALTIGLSRYAPNEKERKAVHDLTRSWMI